MDLVRIIGRFAKPYSGLIVAVLLLQLITTLATLYLPDLNADIIDNGVAKGDVPYIWSTGRVMLVVSFAQVVAAVSAVWFASQVGMKTGRDIRKAVFDHVTEFNAEDISRFGTATLVTRGTNDVQQIQMTLLLALNFMVAAPIMAIGGVIMALRQDPGMSWLVIAAVVTLAVVVTIIATVLMPMFRQMQTRLDTINGILREQIAGIRVVRAFTREEHETERFTEANQALTKLSLNIGRIFVTMFPVIMLILNLATAAVLWFGGHRVDDGLINVGALTAFMQYLMQILMAVMMGVFMLMMLPRAIVCARRVEEVLNHRPSETTNTAHAADGAVVFDNVSYQYPGVAEPVLKHISFTAEPGTTTAIIGSTGSGKSTLMGLIPGLYSPTSGTVATGGRVSMAPQKPWLFSGTVATNLRVANPDATDDQLWEALHIAQASFVDDLHMPISQGGTNVSGGQRQRLCVARAVAANPSILLLDDSLSALDALTGAALQAELNRLPMTKILVAQRVASIEHADQILVMEAGDIVGRGTHDELMNTCETYREIARSQEAVDA